MAKKKSIGKNTSKTSSVKKTIVTYRVLYTMNGNVKKVFLETKERNEALSEFARQMSMSKKVKFRKSYARTNRDGVQPMKVELLLLRSIDINRTHEKDPEKFFKDKWKIANREDFNVEETFLVYGQETAMTCDEIVKLIVSTKTHTRELGILNNKVIIYNSDQFDVILTKCPSDGSKLGKYIYEHGERYNNFFYHGEYKLVKEKSKAIDLIMAETGWSRNKTKKVNISR